MPRCYRFNVAAPESLAEYVTTWMKKTLEQREWVIQEGRGQVT